VEHLDSLDDEIRAFADYELERFRVEGDPQVSHPPPLWLATGDEPAHPAFRDIAQHRRELPPRFGVILGDFLVNLRASLDHAVNGVAGSNAGEYTKFPIVGPPKKGKKLRPWGDVLATDLVGVPPPCQAAIKRMQPYHGHRRGKQLLLLGSLCNLDKHKVLHAATYLVYQGTWALGTGVEGMRATFVDRGVLGDEAEVRVTYGSPLSAPKVEGGAPYQIGFADAPGFSKVAVVNRVDLGVILTEVGRIIVEIGDAALQPRNHGTTSRRAVSDGGSPSPSPSASDSEDGAGSA
jgi:hypothetical protein